MYVYIYTNTTSPQCAISCLTVRHSAIRCCRALFVAKILHSSTRFYEIWCQFQSCIYSIFATRKGLIGQWFTFQRCMMIKCCTLLVQRPAQQILGNNTKQRSFFVYISEMYDAKRLQLCTHYMITIVQLTSVNCSKVRKN